MTRLEPQTLTEAMETTIVWDEARYDTSGGAMWSDVIPAEASRVVAPVSGIYAIDATLFVDALGEGQVELFINVTKLDMTVVTIWGGIEEIMNVSTDFDILISGSTQYFLNAGEYVTVSTVVNAGGAGDAMLTYDEDFAPVLSVVRVA